MQHRKTCERFNNPGDTQSLIFLLPPAAVLEQDGSRTC